MKRVKKNLFFFLGGGGGCLILWCLTCIETSKQILIVALSLYATHCIMNEQYSCSIKQYSHLTNIVSLFSNSYAINTNE